MAEVATAGAAMAGATGDTSLVGSEVYFAEKRPAHRRAVRERCQGCTKDHLPGGSKVSGRRCLYLPPQNGDSAPQLSRVSLQRWHHA
jgi:hypothetical protein